MKKVTLLSVCVLTFISVANIFGQAQARAAVNDKLKIKKIVFEDYCPVDVYTVTGDNNFYYDVKLSNLFPKINQDLGQLVMDENEIMHSVAFISQIMRGKKDPSAFYCCLTKIGDRYVAKVIRLEKEVCMGDKNAADLSKPRPCIFTESTSLEDINIFNLFLDEGLTLDMYYAPVLLVPKRAGNAL